jgi:hypothetical protein
MKKLMIVLLAVILCGCALEPWGEKEHTRFANRYCGGVQNYDPYWGECKGQHGSMVGKQAAPVQVYNVKPGDADAARANSPGGVIFQRD